MPLKNLVLSKLKLLSEAIRSIFFILIIISFTVNVFGTVKKISLEEKTKKASLIVIGIVKHSQSQWEELDGGKKIFTYVHIDVEKYIKGSGEKLIEIKVPGGKVGEITEGVPDAPHFTLGEMVILFLKPKFFRVVGWHQGKYTIKDDKVAGLGIEINEFIKKIKEILDKQNEFIFKYLT